MGGLSTVKHKTAIWDAIIDAERNSASAPESCALKFLLVSDPLKSGPSISVQLTLMVPAFWILLKWKGSAGADPLMQRLIFGSKDASALLGVCYIKNRSHKVTSSDFGPFIIRYLYSARGRI